MEQFETMLGSRLLNVFLNRTTKPSHLQKNSLLKSKGNETNASRSDVYDWMQQRHQQHSSYRSLDTLILPRINNSLHAKNDYSVIVADCGGCDCSAFILKLLRSAGKNIMTDQQANMISFRIDNVAKHITLIEVNFEKHDLWTSLNFEGCILLYSPSNLCSYKCAIQKLTELRNREKCLLWLIGIISDPASPFVPPRVTTYEQAEAETHKMDGRYWEVIPDGKTPRSPLVYNQIATELVSLISDLRIDVPIPNKITFEFTNHSRAIRKVSRSCDFISFN